MISGFRRGYAADIDSYRSFGTTYRSHHQGSSSPKRGCPEMSVNNYQSTLRNIPEERRSKYLSFRWKTQKQQNTKSPVQAYSYARAVCMYRFIIYWNKEWRFQQVRLYSPTDCSKKQYISWTYGQPGTTARGLHPTKTGIGWQTDVWRQILYRLYVITYCILTYVFCTVK